MSIQTQSVPERRKSAARYALWGFIGSAAGAVIGFSIGWTIGIAMPGWQGLYIFLMAGYFLAGAGAGTTLGITAGKRRIFLVALASASGFTIAFLLSMLGSRGGTITQGIILGGFAGATLGLLLRGWKTAGFLALAGAIACAIISPIQTALRTAAYQNPQTTLVVILEVSGPFISLAILGAVLGTVFGYLENRLIDVKR